MFRIRCWGNPSGDWIWEDFAAAAQEITDKGAADGVYGTYCNVSSDQDVLVMGKDRLQVFGASGRLMDLDDERVRKISRQYQDCLIYWQGVYFCN